MLRPVAEGGQRDPALLGGGGAGDGAGPPAQIGAVVVGGAGLGGPAEPDAPGLGRRDALGLALADVLALVLGDEGEDLEHQIGDEGAHQVFAAAGVQQGHVDDADIHAGLLGQGPPLVLDLLIVAPQPVDAQDIEQVARLQPFHQFFVLRTVEVLAGLLVHIDVPLWDLPAVQRDHLPVLVLVGAGYPDVSIDLFWHRSPSVSYLAHRLALWSSILQDRGRRCLSISSWEKDEEGHPEWDDRLLELS